MKKDRGVRPGLSSELRKLLSDDADGNRRNHTREQVRLDGGRANFLQVLVHHNGVALSLIHI